jgi:hypothetical protein
MRGEQTAVTSTQLLTSMLTQRQIADQFGNNRTSANLDANILLLGRVVTSAAGPYPETITTAGSSLRVSAFQSVVLAHSVNSGFYLGRYILQRTALRPNQLTYLRTSIGARRANLQQYTLSHSCASGHMGGMLATYYGSLTSLDSPAVGLGSPAVAVGTAVDGLNGASALPATAGVFGVR